MHFPHLHFIFFERATRWKHWRPNPEIRDLIHWRLLQTASRVNNTRWHWEISFKIGSAGLE